MSPDSWRRFFWVCVFGATMGYFEAAVVVYLRALYYPEGFRFPLVGIENTDPTILAVELGREIASIGMLLAVGMLAGRRGLERAFYFICGFGVWDLCYYLFLYVFLGWPASLAAWDLLFLIPLPWVAPVWAPAIIAALFVASAVVFLIQEDRGRPMNLTAGEWIVSIAAALVIVFGFCVDGVHVMNGGLPRPFQWWWWAAGVAVGLAVFGRVWRRAERHPSPGGDDRP